MATPIKYEWDLGNGQTSFIEKPITIYTAGLYDVTMTVHFDDNSTQTITKQYYISVSDGNNNNLTSDYVRYPKSLHFGWAEEHGYGWAENAGEQWLWPESNASIMRYEEGGNVEKIVWDMYTRQPYVINTRDTSHDEAVYKDRVEVDGTGGYDIATEMVFPEWTGEMEHYDITHQDTYIRFRPETNEDGYLDDFSASIALIVDRKSEPVETSVDIDPSLEQTFYYQNNQLGSVQTNQIKVTTTSSMYQMMGYESYYKTADRCRRASRGDGNNAMKVFGNVETWLTRYDYTLNRATGLYTANPDLTSVTGPDGKTDSGVTIGDTLIDVTVSDSVASVVFWSVETRSTYTPYGDKKGDWQLYYTNTPIVGVNSIGGTIFDYRTLLEPLDETLLKEYYDKLELFLPR